MVTLGQFHLALAVVALLSGALIVGSRKGTGTHRLIGFIYASSMFGMLVSAMLIYELTGGFGPFHVLALISLVTLGFGVGHVLLRRPKRNWVTLHAYWMSWSYVGLLAAGVSEAATRLPDAPFWWAVAVGSAIVISIGAWVINSRVPRILMRDFPNG